ncbi:gluconate 2-dehydrogenase subunit 3 family protein [uncultured Tateyamaria sp.]|uniref:gluconate 2-dehydrogenase subunit 3 family protein n=1 Tax=uncultured Tateyamaria sp. TaxID=455651 RepID=UPI00260589A0|nr:gluconate 2-dehydrogenase subunit 3 family protein [uncultured Tateyamaria sp.]
MSALAASLSPPAFAQQIAATEGEIDAKTLAAYLDILLPADEHTPAASALGIEGDIIGFARQLTQFNQLLVLGTQWLNQTGQGPFHALSLSDQGRVVDWMRAADRNFIPGRFFLLVRLTGVEFYYSRPEAVAGFDLNPAPQPAGYPPPWQ